jgi:hypothetical protein
MSIWNLPLPVETPVAHTPTPAPLASIARTFGRYSRALTEPAANDTAEQLERSPGVERVRVCALCGVDSTADVRGAQGWRLLFRDRTACRDVCPDCAPKGATRRR